MKIIYPKAEIIKTTGNVLKDIEFAGRNCYLSYDRVKEGSEKKLVKSLIKRGHTAMLEFGNNIIIQFNIINNELEVLLGTLLASGDYKFVNFTFLKPNKVVFSMNPRTALRLINFIRNIKYDNYDISFELHNILLKYYEDLASLQEEFDNYYYDIKEKFFKVISEDDLETYEENLKHKYFTAKLITTRPTLAQLTRHRIDVSYAVTSMRFINWTKDKFGSEMSFVSPVWRGLGDKFGESYQWVLDCQKSEDDYFRMVNNGFKPEEARCKVSTDIRTDILVKASVYEWYNHIFKERCSPYADIEIRRVMEPLKEQMDNKLKNLKNLINEKEIVGN